MVVKAQSQGVDLKGATLFINLLPCPHCARALALTGLAEIVYSQDHSAGYAITLFEQMDKKVRRLLPEQQPEL
jgi:deoxycytidylate deaminase